MSKEFEQAYKDYCEGKVEDPAELLRVMWKENKEAIDTFIAKGGFYATATAHMVWADGRRSN
jgi:hypothetical protein